MKVKISVPEAVTIFKEIQKQPEKVFEMIRVEIRESVGKYLSKMMGLELTDFLGRVPYERKERNTNHRNGSYNRRFTLKGIGEVDLKVPRDRKGNFKTQVIPRSKRYEDEIRQDLCLMFLTGISTRTLSMISTRLIGRKISPAEISNVNKELIDAVEKWRSRDLSEESIKYLFLDGVCFHMRIDGSIETVPVLVAIGVTETGRKLVLGLQAGDKESASNWREFIKDLKKRGLDGRNATLGIMDYLGWKGYLRKSFQRLKSSAARYMWPRMFWPKCPRN